MATAGILAGALCGYALARVAASYFADMRMPGVVPVAASAAVLLARRGGGFLFAGGARGAGGCDAGAALGMTRRLRIFAAAD